MSSDTSPQDVNPAHRQSSADDDEIDLLQLWIPIWRRKWGIVSLVAVVMMLAALVVLNITPIYRAVATLLIEQRAAKAVSIEEIYGLEGSGSEYLQTQFELLKSRELAERVVLELRLTEHPEFDPRQQPEPFLDPKGWWADLDVRRLLPFTLPEDLEPREADPAEILDQVVDAFGNRITVSPVMKTQLVKIHVDMADAQLAAIAANALAKAYIESQLEAKLSMSQTATSWMNSQLTELKYNLQLSEQRLQLFREQENLVDVQGVTTVSAGELSGTGSRLIDARRARAEAESQYRQVSTMRDGGWDRLATVPAVLSDPLVQQFRAAEAMARSKVQEMTRKYGPKYPKMIAAQTELNSATASLKAQVEQVVASIEREYQLALANEQSLQSSFEQNKGEIQDITRKEFELRELQREVDTNRQLYDTFMTRLKETSATQDFDAVNARVVEKAVAPKVPVKPKKSLIVLISGLLALFCGVGLTLLMEMLNNTFKGTDDVENRLNLPVLGILPLVKQLKNAKLTEVFRGNADKAFSESMRTIRTSLVLSGLDDPHKVILVTSSVPGEGKTTLASNLALALGQMHKVLLIDADLRRPSLRKNFELPVGLPGVANYIAGTATLEDCLRPVAEGVDLLSAGTVPPNPQELLASPRFEELLESLKPGYGYIVIDSPPSLAVSDAVLLSRVADSVVYVVKSLSTAIPLAQRGVGQLLQKNAPVTGVVLNQVDIKKAEKYGYSYGGYYDHYGYGH